MWRKDTSAHTKKWRGWVGRAGWKMSEAERGVPPLSGTHNLATHCPPLPPAASTGSQKGIKASCSLSTPSLAGAAHPAGQGKVCPDRGVGLPVGGTSCAEPFPARCHFLRFLQPLAGFPRLRVPAGPPTHCTSLPSQPISLFLASNEAINELYRSPKLSLELDG